MAFPPRKNPDPPHTFKEFSIKAGIIIVADGYKPAYRPMPLYQDSLNNRGLPLEIFRKRFSAIPGVEDPALVVSDTAGEAPLIEQAKALGMKARIFSSGKIREKPRSFTQDRWQMASSGGQDFWLGEIFAEVARESGWDQLIVVPIYNLLVDRVGLIESLALHRREAFDVTFSEDRLPGADWVILESILLQALQKNHPEIMATRGGLAWMIKKPLYPFKIGAFHLPRNPSPFHADLRLQTGRVHRTFSDSSDDQFASPEFSYVSWLESSNWKEVITDSGPVVSVVEPTNICHGACFACPNPSMQRERGTMSEDTFQKLHQSFSKVPELRWIFSGMGEPLLNPLLKEMVEITGTQHSMLVSSLQCEVPSGLDWSRLDLVRVSVDAVESGGFKKWRPGCSWERVESFVASAGLRKEKNPDGEPEIGVGFLRHQENSGIGGDFLRYWKKVCQPPFTTDFFVWPPETPPNKVQWYQIIGLSDYLGQIPFLSDVRYTPLKRRFCPHALTGFHILWDGRVVICPYDYEGKWVLGDLRQSTPDEIWKSRKARDFRKQHLERTFDDFFPCSQCQDWYHRE